MFFASSLSKKTGTLKLSEQVELAELESASLCRRLCVSVVTERIHRRNLFSDRCDLRYEVAPFKVTAMQTTPNFVPMF